MADKPADAAPPKSKKLLLIVGVLVVVLALNLLLATVLYVQRGEIPGIISSGTAALAAGQEAGERHRVAPERVRQRIARALFHEYGISVDDMEPDFKVKVEESGRSSNKKIDIAIFESGSEHTPENVRRLVVCQKEPKIGDKGAYKMRDHEQAAKDLELLKEAMAACENCKYGLWTNGLEFFFFQVKRTKFDVKFVPIGDWPLADGCSQSHREITVRKHTPQIQRDVW